MNTYNLLRFASWITKWIPVPLGYWLCQLAGGIAFYIKPSLRKQVMANMKRVVPDASTLRRRSIARRVIRNNLKNYYDLVRLPHITPEQMERMVTVRGIEHLDNAFAGGKGVIVFSGHIGNFNLVPQLVVLRGYTGAIVAEDIKPEKLYDLLNELRSRFGLKFIKAGSSEIRTIVHLVRNNGMLLLAADRDVTDAGEPVTFFGETAELASGPVALALRMKVPLLPAHTVRLKNNKSIVTIYPPLKLEYTGDRERDVTVNMPKVVHMLEHFISKAPDQWVASLNKIWDKERTAQPDNTRLTVGPAERSGNGNAHRAEVRTASYEDLSPSSNSSAISAISAGEKRR